MRKILITDDEPYMIMLLKETLEKLEDKGVKLLTANNGREAIESIKAERPEFVILDIIMPEMNGFEVIYVLMLTTDGQGFNKRKSTCVGADLFMTKPFDPDAIIKEVSRVLKIEI
ncbi:MAG: response regulator [Planctomycetota bacterium]|jgi:CheY-like chemotaxis protein